VYSLKENFYHINPDLLVKYLLGEATPEERTLTEEWINASETHCKEFDDFRLIWDASRELAVASTVNEEESWQRFRRRIQSPLSVSPASASRAVLRPIHRRLPILRVAALLLLAIGAGWLLRQWLPVEKAVSIRSYGAVLRDTLPDGSVVTLNKNSALSYTGRFRGDTRQVGLQGEAFFNVAPDKKKPFIIQVNDVTIKVVGTSFNVRSIRGHTQVMVETGAVQVSRRRHMVELHANERVDITGTDSVITRQTATDKLYNYYSSREFVCNNTPLWKLVEVLEEAYGARIIIARPALRSLPITTTFNEESLDTILGIISKTFNISYKKTASEVVLQ
jgi:ferric-dicitrate binding protein FerR (iron transport regulator)